MNSKASTRGVATIAVVLALFALVGSATTAHARVQRVEAVGNYGIREGMRAKVIPRDEAVQHALWEGVSRVALELMGEDAGFDLDGSDSEAEDQASEVLRSALGSDMLPYTRRFRILQDKGESPVLFEEDPAVQVEYVVVVEVLVDVDRVTSALSSAGLVHADGGGGGTPVSVELVGVDRYRAFAAIRDALRSEIGATRVETLGFAQDRQLLSVQSRFGPAALAKAIERLDLSRVAVDLESIEVDEIERKLRFRGRSRIQYEADPANFSGE